MPCVRCAANKVQKNNTGRSSSPRSRHSVPADVDRQLIKPSRGLHCAPLCTLCGLPLPCRSYPPSLKSPWCPNQPSIRPPSRVTPAWPPAAAAPAYMRMACGGASTTRQVDGLPSLPRCTSGSLSATSAGAGRWPETGKSKQMADLDWPRCCRRCGTLAISERIRDQGCAAVSCSAAMSSYLAHLGTCSSSQRPSAPECR